MKTIIIGDLHGKDVWKKILASEGHYDKVVFLGDYFDSFDIPGDTQVQNFQNLLTLKEENPDKVVLLYGNHEHHYVVDGEHYSGFQNKDYADTIKVLVQFAIDRNMVQMCHVIEGSVLCIHAGLTRSFCARNEIKETDNIEAVLNAALVQKPEIFNFYRKDISECGEHISQSPVWVRPKSLAKDCVEGYMQVVGHTHMPHISYKNSGDLIFIDVLDSEIEYIVWDSARGYRAVML